MSVSQIDPYRKFSVNKFTEAYDLLNCIDSCQYLFSLRKRYCGVAYGMDREAMILDILNNAGNLEELLYLYQVTIPAFLKYFEKNGISIMPKKPYRTACKNDLIKFCIWLWNYKVPSNCMAMLPQQNLKPPVYKSFQPQPNMNVGDMFAPVTPCGIMTRLALQELHNRSSVGYSVPMIPAYADDIIQGMSMISL